MNIESKGIFSVEDVLQRWSQENITPGFEDVMKEIPADFKIYEEVNLQNHPQFSRVASQSRMGRSLGSRTRHHPYLAATVSAPSILCGSTGSTKHNQTFHPENRQYSHFSILDTQPRTTTHAMPYKYHSSQTSHSGSDPVGDVSPPCLPPRNSLHKTSFTMKNTPRKLYLTQSLPSLPINATAELPYHNKIIPRSSSLGHLQERQTNLLKQCHTGSAKSRKHMETLM